MQLAAKYQWLTQEPGPKVIQEFLKVYGVVEGPGDTDNPVILSWAREVGIFNYIHDSTAWCGLLMALLHKRAGKEIPKDPLWALNWAKVGVKVPQPKLGDILTFKRKGGGHVGLYIGEDSQCYHVAGGNQGDRATIIRIEKTRLFQARRVIYIKIPDNVRVIKLSASGSISLNEQ